jgi:hypothetical protein
MWRAMMLCDVIGEKASFIRRRRDFQSIAVLLAQAPAGMIQMIKDAETGGWMAKGLHTHILFSVSPKAANLGATSPSLTGRDSSAGVASRYCMAVGPIGVFRH